MDKRWRALNYIGHVNGKKTEGFYNDNTLGVCSLNVVLSLIMSSTYLMKEIRAIAPSDNYYEQMNQVTNYLQRKPATIEQVKILPRDVLRQAICNTHDNIKYPSNYGVGGDYMALKRFLSERGQDFDDESDFVKERNKYSPCEATIYETFKIILKNLFEVDNVNYNAPNKNFNYQFYKDLNMLLIDFNLKNVIYDPTSPKPIDKEYFKEIGENIMSQINTQLTMEHIEPNIILFNFDYTPNLKVHDVTFVDLRKHIRSAIKDDLLNPRPNLKIILSRQLFTIPKITGNIFTYPFPISRKIVQYRLKGISFILEEEIETNLSDFPNVKGPSADLKECMDQLKARTLKDIKDTYEKVMTSLFFDKNSGLFAGLCLEITDPLDVYGKLETEQLPFHTFSIILKNDQWFLMNDQFSHEIEDIAKFTEELSNEQVDAILLEKQ